MATFVYEAMREPGEVIKGELDAEDATAAASSLIVRGYHVIRVTDANALAGRRVRLRLGMWGGLKRRDLVRFTRDTSSLLRAGLPLSQALVTLRNRAGKSGWRAVLGGLRARLEDGQTFSQALAAYPNIFDAMYVNLVRAGEESGKLIEVLTRLADLGEKRDEIQARVKMAMVYPAVMLVVGIATVFVMVSFVVPMFMDVFEETGQTLPLVTRMLVGVSRFMAKWWPAVIGGACLGVFLAGRYVKTRAGRRLVDGLVLRAPLVGRVLRQYEIGAFARTLGTLLGSGIPVVSALNITASTLRNTRYSEAVRAMVAEVREGGLVSACVGACALFPESVSNVLAVGEQTGDIAGAFHQLADENERDIDREVKVMMTLMEPLMIVLMGLVVGFIVIAMLLPIFSLGDAIQM